MEENRDEISFEEVLDDEIDDIWDIFFPYMAEKKGNNVNISAGDKKKPRRHLRFLTM